MRAENLKVVKYRAVWFVDAVSRSGLTRSSKDKEKMMRISTALSVGLNNDLLKTTGAIARSLERLSSGLRVQTPRDDAYAYRLGQTLQAQIRGITQANIHANTALGLVETADGALETQLDLLQELRQLAVEASSTTLTSTERSNIDTEVQALLEEFRRITKDTEFDGLKLLDGSFVSRSIQVGANKSEMISVEIGSLQASSVFQKNVGTGTFASRTTLSAATEPYGVALADFNQDGKLDMASVSRTSGLVQINDGRGDGTFLAARTYSVGTTPEEIRVGDVTGDGVIDLVVGDTGSSTISILAGNGDGTFDTRTTLSPGGVPKDFELADINNDGVLDIISIAQAVTFVGIYTSNGDGTFTLSQTLQTGGGGPSNLATGDVNGDSYADILVTNSTAGTLGVIFGSASGTMSFGSTVTVGTAPSGVTLLDMDLDGDLDVAVSNATTGNVSLLRNSGTGIFTATATLTAGTKPEDVKAADLNKDGYQDLFVLNDDSRNISVFLATGGFSFGTATTVSVGGLSQNGAFDMALGDLNGDGVVDIVAPQTGNTTASDGNEIGIILSYSTKSSAESDVKVNTATQASDLISIIDTAISNINNERSKLAGVHSRLESAYAANLLIMDSLDQALSSAVDADVALETAELVRNQVLQQAQVAAMTQANIQLQTVLGLLEG